MRSFVSSCALGDHPRYFTSLTSQPSNLLQTNLSTPPHHTPLSTNTHHTHPLQPTAPVPAPARLLLALLVFLPLFDSCQVLLPSMSCCST
jgi:hypothetical protein